MTGQAPYQIVLTPEQRRILGQVYQLILSWRRKRLSRGEELNQFKSTGSEGASIELRPDSANPSEGES